MQMAAKSSVRPRDVRETPPPDIYANRPHKAARDGESETETDRRFFLRLLPFDVESSEV